MNEKIKEPAKVADRWRKLFFWDIAALAVNILFNHWVIELLPVLGHIEILATMICVICSVVILFKMGTVVNQYKIAGCCQILYLVCHIIMTTPYADASFIAAIVAVVIFCIGGCKELKAHWMMFTGVNEEMANKWQKLHKWLVINSFTALGSVVMIVINGFVDMSSVVMSFVLSISVLGSLVLPVVVIGVVVIYILRFVYLHKSAYVFEGLAKTLEYREDMAEGSISEYNGEE